MQMPTPMLYLNYKIPIERFVYSLSTEINSRAKANYILPRKGLLDDILGLKVNKSIKQKILKLPRKKKEVYVLFFWVGDNGEFHYKLVDDYLESRDQYTTPFYSPDGTLMDLNRLRSWSDEFKKLEQGKKPEKDMKDHVERPALIQPKLRSVRLPKFAYTLEYLMDEYLERTLAKWHVREKNIPPIEFGDGKHYGKFNRAEYVYSEMKKSVINGI